jgi:LmbE family N-acetylglucosaminyl deacetylase
MLHLGLDRSPGKPLTILCLGAHSDDIEIGCGGTILRLVREHPGSIVHWVVFSAVAVREEEARRAAPLFAGASLKTLLIKDWRDGFMPFVGSDVKQTFESELKTLSPDLIFTHKRIDAHQDHRLIADLTWNTFRDHLILEYEIPKYDGDLGQPNVYVPLEDELYKRKVQLITDVFASQRTKHWFKPELFLSLMRVRGMECNAQSGYAEAFCGHKIVL